MARQSRQSTRDSANIPPGTKFYSPFPFGGMNLQASPIAVADQECILADNFLLLGPGKFRTAWDAGAALYTAPRGRTIISFFFYTIATTYYVAVFLDNGSAIQVDVSTKATTTIGSAGTFYQSGGSLPACSQWGVLYLLISNNNTTNDYWAWDGSLLYTAGTAAPNGVVLASVGRNYSSTPTITAYGGHGAGMTFDPVVQDGGVELINIVYPGQHYEVGDIVQLQFAGGGSDSSAVLIAQLNATGVAAANITSAGSGYSTATVSISGGGGSGAAATATIGSGVASVTVTNPGSGYTSATVSFSGGSGSGAVAVAVVFGGQITAVTITSGGSGFTSPPSVAINGDGTGATATCTIDSGTIVAITITDNGSGYSSAPSIIITGDGSGATAVAVLTGSSVHSVSVVSNGSGFTSVPLISFEGGNGSGATGTVLLAPTTITRVDVTSGGSNYQYPPTIVFNPGTLGGSGAAASPVMANGQLIGVTLSNGGSGYVGDVQILVQPDPNETTGSGATAIARLSPTSVSSVLIGNGGVNYTDAPAVVVSPGANHAASATVTLMPFGVSGSAMETWQSRVWIAVPAQTPNSTLPPQGDFQVSAAGDLTQFATSLGGVQFTNSDAFLQTTYTNFKQSGGYLYAFGDGQVSVISSVQTTGDPTTTTFNYQNVDPQVGLSWRDTLQDFGRTLIASNETGVFGLYGGAATKISDKLNDLFATAKFPSTFGALTPSSSLATLFDVKHYLMLMTMLDPRTGATVNKMITWNERDWTLTSQSVALTYIGPQKVESKFYAWGTDGTKLYPLFAQPSANLVKRYDTKLYGSGAAGFLIKDMTYLYVQAQDQSSGPSGVDVELDVAVSGLAVQSDEPIDETVSSRIAVNPLLYDVQFDAPSPAWPLFGTRTTGVPFVTAGVRLTTSSPDFILGNLLVAYTDIDAFM
jgi:hypothetical protein